MADGYARTLVRLGKHAYADEPGTPSAPPTDGEPVVFTPSPLLEANVTADATPPEHPPRGRALSTPEAPLLNAAHVEPAAGRRARKTSAPRPKRKS